MARYKDHSPHPAEWTNAKLIRELKRVTSFETAGLNLPEGYKAIGWHMGRDAPAIIEATRIYRQTWLEPIIAEIERRFVKVK